jgi:hypothetical protein
LPPFSFELHRVHFFASGGKKRRVVGGHKPAPQEQCALEKLITVSALVTSSFELRRCICTLGEGKRPSRWRAGTKQSPSSFTTKYWTKVGLSNPRIGATRGLFAAALGALATFVVSTSSAQVHCRPFFERIVVSIAIAHETNAEVAGRHTRGAATRIAFFRCRPLFFEASKTRPQLYICHNKNRQGS